MLATVASHPSIHALPCHFRSVETGFLSGQKADDRGFPAGDAVVVAFPQSPPSSRSPPRTGLVEWTVQQLHSLLCSCTTGRVRECMGGASRFGFCRAVLRRPGRAEPMPWLMGGHWHYPPWLDINYSLLHAVRRMSVRTLVLGYGAA